MASNKKEGELHWIIGSDSPQEECLFECMFQKTILSPTDKMEIHENIISNNSSNNCGKDNNKKEYTKNLNNKLNNVINTIDKKEKNNRNVDGCVDEIADESVDGCVDGSVDGCADGSVDGNVYFKSKNKSLQVSMNEESFPIFNIVSPEVSEEDDEDVDINFINKPSYDNETHATQTPTSAITTTFDDLTTASKATLTISKAKALLAYILGGRNYNEMDRHTYWTHLFNTYFLSDPCLGDDLMFYVKMAYAFKMPMPEVEVYRSNSTNQPSLNNVDVQWEETVYLNFILHHMDYYLTCAVCTRTGEKELQILKKSTCKVYASPSHRSLEFKENTEQMTYPYIYFTVDNYDEVFSDITIHDTELVCTELVAKDRQQEQLCVLFLGSIRYQNLINAFETKGKKGSNSNLNNRSGSNSSLKMISSWFKEESKIEYISMKGPGGKGQAEVAVSVEKEISSSSPSSSFLTPSLENLYKCGFHGNKKSSGVGGGSGGSGKGLFSSASETGMGHRQMSDPNMSVSYYCSYGGSGGGSGGGYGGSGFYRKRSQSENEKVDGEEIHEVVCSYLHEELEEKQNGYPNICDSNNKTLFNKKPKSPSKKTTPKRKKSTTTSTTPTSVHHTTTRKRNVAINLYNNNYSNNNINYNNQNKTFNNNNKVYNSKWFEEQRQRRQQSRKLSAYITYITLPWHQIIADLLEQRQKPVISHSYS